jgi:Putative zinc-finger
VLGALSPAERREFEEHMASCLTCQFAVSELAAHPGLLAQVSPADPAMLSLVDDARGAPSPSPRCSLLPGRPPGGALGGDPDRWSGGVRLLSLLQEDGGGLLGASGDCYRMLRGEVPDEVRAICDELCRREAKPSIWA